MLRQKIAVMGRLGAVVWGFLFASALGCAASPPAGNAPARSASAIVSIEGAWEGTLEVGPARLLVVLKIKRTGSGWTATADSPDQNAYDIPVDRVAVDGNRVTIDLLRIDASYEARFDRDRLTGTMTQHGQARPLDLKRSARPSGAHALRPLAAGEPALDGAWAGALQVGVVRLRLVAKFRRAAAGWLATVDSLDQHARDIPVGAVTVHGDSLKLDLPQINARYEARIAGDKLAGKWTQNAQVLPLDLTSLSDRHDRRAGRVRENRRDDVPRRADAGERLDRPPRAVRAEPSANRKSLDHK